MSNPSSPPWAQQVAEFVGGYLDEPAEIVAAVTNGVLETAHQYDDGSWLRLLRVHNRTIEREEVFMGGVVFNDWIFKSLPRSVELAGLGKAIGVTNDLETAYVLVATDESSDDIRDAFRQYLYANLPALFFEDEAPARGLHGTFAGMHGILNSQRDPFPVYAVPRFLARDLERHVRKVLRELIARDLVRMAYQKGGKQERKPSLELRYIQTAMAYFYARTSGGEGDSQSQATFMTRLAYTYGVVTPAELRHAYNLTPEQAPDTTTTITPAEQKSVKNAVKAAVDLLAFDEAHLRQFLYLVLDRLGIAIDAEPDNASDAPPPGQPYLDSWFVPYLRTDGKFIDLSPADYLDRLLHGISVGTQPMTLTSLEQGWPCRTCGEQGATVAECNILLGVSVNKFYNQLPNQKPAASGDRICVRCALYSYLGTKLFGCTSVGSFPVPKQDNVIFHVGHHTQAEVEKLGKLLQDIIKAVRQLRDERFESLRIDDADEEKIARAERKTSVVEVLHRQQAGEAISPGDEAILKNSFDEAPEVQAIFEQLGGDCKVIDLGMGDQQRLVAFALPQLPGDNDLTQKRFVRARITVYALIGFLQTICKCEQRGTGAYYFRTVPRLDAGQDGYQDDMFYVEDHKVSGRQYRTRYRTAAAFAFRVTRRSKDSTSAWLRLSELLSDEPLETFSAVLRDTAYRSGEDRKKDGRYKVPATGDGVSYDADLYVSGGQQYLAAFQSLHSLWEDSLGTTEQPPRQDHNMTQRPRTNSEADR